MSSQDSEGESYVADFLADHKDYRDLEHCGWTTEEEEDYTTRKRAIYEMDTNGAPHVWCAITI